MKPKEKLASYICPHCKNRQTEVVEWQDVAVAEKFSLETGQYVKCVDQIDESAHADWCCPECGESIEKKFGSKIYSRLFE